MMRVVSRWNRWKKCYRKNCMGESELERLVRGCRKKPGVDSRDEGKHTGKNDLLFVEKMM